MKKNKYAGQVKKRCEAETLNASEKNMLAKVEQDRTLRQSLYHPIGVTAPDIPVDELIAYAGLSSDVVEKLDKIDLTSFTTPQVSTRTMTFAFVDSEAERLNAVLEDLDGLPAKEIWLADVKQFDRFFDLLEATKKTFDVRNASLAMLKLMDLAEEAIANHKPEQAAEGAA